ncbi:MAG: GH39 family glycosyl hydrolase [Bacillota bacterium]
MRTSLVLQVLCLLPFFLAACSTPHPSSNNPQTQIPSQLLPAQPLASIPVSTISIDASASQGPLEAYRHTIGHGGVNALPLPDPVVTGLSKLKPRLIRIFIQEFFNIYPDHNRFDWSRLDPYMDSLARTGAHVVAAITIKPKPLYPTIDPNIWWPNDIQEWQRVIHALVKRYSVDKPIVTYWEIGNETDIGENGGCPYLIADPNQYLEYYQITIPAILVAFPSAKVGGTAVANASSDYLPRFIEACKQQRLQLDFISWHLYSDSPEQHAGLVQKYRSLLEDYPGKRPEMLVTEWSKGFEPISVEDQAFNPRRAAITAASLFAMMDAHLDWSFYYHAWDQVCYIDSFRPFFRDPNIMFHHWNEVPHRFGLFGVGGEPRPQYFVYQMLSRLGDQRLQAQTDEKEFRILAAKDANQTSIMVANLAWPKSQDRLATLRFTNLPPGRKQLKIYRIDRACAWSPTNLELIPIESREVDTETHFSCQAYCPADSVTRIVLETRR